jgi:maltooligosyltrehalose trehalohydrolase
MTPASDAATRQPPNHADTRRERHAALGANVVDGGVQFRVWAPDAQRIDVQIEDVLFPLVREDGGVWYGFVPGIAAGVRYRYRIDDRGAFPDPYARSQPDGPHGPSEIVDPDTFAWHDEAWPGLPPDGLVIYELHVGCYTPEGTFEALIDELDALKRLGVNAVELMPVAEFPGARNWGYDGVDLFAPSRNYGGPDGLRRLVDAAHQRGLGVILDVVYNHFGPDGNYLLQFSPRYVTDRYATPWGDAVNYDGDHSDMVRRFIVDNACHWLREYHIDGLRLDATFAIFDRSPRHILEEIATNARACVDRRVVMMAETHENDARYLRSASEGGFGFDAVWADDFHHAVHTTASHEHIGYYADYDGTLEQLARTIRRGWLFEGQPSDRFGGTRGTPSDGLPARSFVYCIQNHDQVGNRAFGRRFSHLVGTGLERPWAALLLLLPYTPMLFMGQEFAASSRFYFFTDHNPELGRLVTEGRRKEFARFTGFDDPRQQREIPDPQSEHTFFDSKLDLHERDEGVGEQTYRMYAELLGLRRRDAVLQRQDRTRMDVDVAGDLLLVHMWHGREHRLLAANLGMGVDAAPSAIGVPRKLLGPRWQPIISTDERRFGGTDGHIRFDGHLVSMPPHTVAWLAASEPLLPGRMLRALRRRFSP